MCEQKVRQHVCFAGVGRIGCLCSDRLFFFCLFWLFFFFIGIAHRCIQPNAWFHWAYQINEENAWSAASNAVNYRIYVPGTSLPAIQVYRRADVAMEGYMLIVGVVFSVVGVVVARWLLKNNDQYGLITKGVLWNAKSEVCVCTSVRASVNPVCVCSTKMYTYM